MYRKAKSEMKIRGFTLEFVSREMGLTITTLSRKLSGKQIITVDEAKLFKKIIGTDLPLEVLFEKVEEAC